MIKTIKIYNSRKAAFDAYFDGTAIEKIKYENEKGESQHLSYAEINRWMKRCLETTATGNIYGYTGLIPYYHIEPYKRTKSCKDEMSTSGQSGIFTRFLKLHPEIDDMIKQKYLAGGTSEIKTKGTKGIDIYKEMMRMCADMNLYNEYPLNRTASTKHPGKRALYDYLKQLRSSYYRLYAKHHLTEDAVTLAATTGVGQKNNPLPVDLFQMIEIDEHTIDGKFIIDLLTYEGDEFKEVVDNITLIAAVDHNSQALIGHHIVPGKSFTSQDIMRCIINCLIPHKRMTFNVKGFNYPSDVCFTSEIAPEMEWATFGQIMFDNHMTHKSAEIRYFLENELDVHVNYGPLAHPTVRTYIEKSFDLLKENVFTKLPSTTGGSKDSPLRNNPEEQAVKYGITFNDAKQIIELGIANYNVSSKMGNYNMTPIQTIKSRLSAGRIPKKLEEYKRSKVTTITNKVSVTVLGNLEKGRNPYVNYKYARYTSKKLAAEKSLIGEKLTLVINIDDARYAKAYKQNGEYLDTLTANGKWGIIEHTLNFRIKLCTLRNTNELDFLDTDDFMEVYKQYISKHHNAKVANDFIRDAEEEIARSSKNSEIPEVVKEDDEISIDALIPNADDKTTFVQQQNQVTSKLKNNALFEQLSKDMQFKF